MASVLTVGSQRRGSGRRFPRISAVAAAFGLDGVALVLFACVLALVSARSGGRRTPGESFFSDLAPAVLLLAAATVAIAAGALAGVSLVRSRPITRVGRAAARLAVVNALLLPVVAGSVEAVAWIARAHLPEGWGQPIVPFWLAAGLGAAVLGAVAPEPGRRGLLVVPLMIGAFVLTFWLGEVLVPH